MVKEETKLVGYTGYNECLEIRYSSHKSQVWDHATEYGVGLGMDRGYWLGTEREHVWVGLERRDVEEYARRSLDDSPVRWVE